MAIDDQDLERVREMTIGALLDKCSPPSLSADDHKNRQAIVTALSVILEAAQMYYEDYAADDVCDSALRIACRVVENESLNARQAQLTTEDMAYLADEMLQSKGAGEWDFGTLVALKKIRRSDSALAKQEWECKNGGTATPRTQADANCPI
jgi:hypothetical protein